jgi:hypothetical protein
VDIQIWRLVDPGNLGTSRSGQGSIAKKTMTPSFRLLPTSVSLYEAEGQKRAFAAPSLITTSFISFLPPSNLPLLQHVLL